MTEEKPNWETAVRQSAPEVIDDRSMAVREKCFELADRIRCGRQVREQDLEDLALRIDELEYYVENVLEPIAVDDRAERCEDRDTDVE